MTWLFRPGVVVGISVSLLAVAGVLLVFPFGPTDPENQALPRPVPPGDQEVVWLNAATNSSWERFVASVYRLQIDRPDLKLEIGAVALYNEAVRIAREEGDNASRELFERLLKDEEEHVDWLEAQVYQIQEIGYERYLSQQIREEK